MKEKKDTNRDSEDIKLVLETSYANNDFSNCYFAYRELQQFFPKNIDKESFLKGAQCSEKNGYFEEAIAAYEEINKENPNLEITAKILRMKYRLTGEELYFNQLKSLVDKNPNNIEMLYCLLDALSKKENIAETTEILKTLYELETKENKPKIVDEFLKYGAVFQAIETLEKLPDDKNAKQKLNEIYNRYMLFDKADRFLEVGKTNAPVWTFLREQIKLKEQGEFEIVSKEVDKMMATLGYCEPALIFLKAEIYRNLGDKQRTFAMIEEMLECNRFYLPGLTFATEIAYYQGDLTKAKNGLKYILDNEQFFSPGGLIFHNYLVLLSAEIMVTEGKENLIIPFLKKNLLKKYLLGKREVERLSDITEKLKESKKLTLINFLQKNYKFSVPLNTL